MSKVRYVKVDWPNSQMFMGKDDCYDCTYEDENNSIYQSVFVPEDVYEEAMKNTDFRYE